MHRSEQLYQQACAIMPAGVSSPVRAFRSVGGTPIYMRRGEGTYIEDVDGKTYLDFCGSWGPLILGHRFPTVQQAVEEVVQRGWTFGTPVAEEVALADLVTRSCDAIDLVRFVNSGTEAVMSAIRLARGITGRDRVLKFTGCYHGHVDGLLVEAGSGLATFGTASSAGVPADYARLTATMALDDPELLESFFASDGHELACVIIEGVPANNGLLVQKKAYLHTLRTLCDQHGVLLIMDEVLTGFRMPNVFASSYYGIRPDLITLGKVIGGGMPVGAYGGSKELMDHIAPLGPVYQAGTLSGNPVAMAAGHATLKHYVDHDVPAQIERLGDYLDQGMQSLLADTPNTGYLRLGSLFWFYFYSKEAPRTAEAIATDAGPAYAKLHRFMLDRGIYMAPSAYEVGFLNAAMETSDLDRFLNVLGDAKKEQCLP